jgi:hypothetical protein
MWYSTLAGKTYECSQTRSHPCSIILATSSAASLPANISTTNRLASRPHVTPTCRHNSRLVLVPSPIDIPSNTSRDRVSHSRDPLIDVLNDPIDRGCVVALIPLNAPAFAASNAPVHIDSMILSFPPFLAGRRSKAPTNPTSTPLPSPNCIITVGSAPGTTKMSKSLMLFIASSIFMSAMTVIH